MSYTEWKKWKQERKTRDSNQVKCIKDKERKGLVEETSIKQRWQAYFHKLLNEEENRDIVLDEPVHPKRLWDFRYYGCFRVDEVTFAISRMSKRRTTRPDKISVDFLKSTVKAHM